MTYNQLMYWQNVETRRRNITDEYIDWLGLQHNRAELAEKQRHNMQDEQVNWGKLAVSQGELAERERSNRAGEAISWFNAQEGQRHNLEGESISWYNAKENARHNSADEAIKWFQSVEQQRTNLANESLRAGELNERIRSDLVNESISQQRQDTYAFDVQSQAEHRTRQDAYTAQHYYKQDYIASERLGLDKSIAAYQEAVARGELDVHQKQNELKQSELDLRQWQTEVNMKYDAQKWSANNVMESARWFRNSASDSMSRIVDMFLPEGTTVDYSAW